jgi:hypothetical protein
MKWKARESKEQVHHQQQRGASSSVISKKIIIKSGTAATCAAAAAATTANLKVLVRGTFCVGRSTSQSTRRYYLVHPLALR